MLRGRVRAVERARGLFACKPVPSFSNTMGSFSIVVESVSAEILPLNIAVASARIAAPERVASRARKGVDAGPG